MDLLKGEIELILWIVLFILIFITAIFAYAAYLFIQLMKIKIPKTVKKKEEETPPRHTFISIEEMNRYQHEIEHQQQQQEVSSSSLQ